MSANTVLLSKHTHTHTEEVRKCAGHDKALHGRNRQSQIGFDENPPKKNAEIAEKKNSPKMLRNLRSFPR
jgi:hypothetical protein